jgi:signal transduction histidine kinase/CheY-like chemotaxis protein
MLVENLPDIATSIAEDNSGRLWLGTTSRGVLVASPKASGAVEAVRGDPMHGLPAFEGAGQAIASPQGALVIFSPRGGWLLGPHSQNFTPIAGLRDGEIVATSEISAEGVLWAAYRQSESSPACVGRITITDDHAVWQPHSIEGLWNIGCPRSILAESDGEGRTVLWIGGAKGLLRHVLSGDPSAPRPRAPLLQAFAQSGSAGSVRPISGPLPYATREVLFQFAAPEFALRPALRMETRIEGIDDRWIPGDATSRRELTALRDGQYTFRVRTVAETGAISDETSFRFEILAPWWRTTPALAGFLLALFPAGYGLYRLRVHSLQRRNAELERKVSQRTEQLEQASAAKTQFVATMSHDIRNPLNGIVGLALALENTRLDPRQREIVATLRECTTYLSTLVDDVLDFASIEAGRVELRPGPFTPGELLRSVVTMLKADTAVSGASLIVEADPELATPLLGDAGRIQQILVNFVSNALKYAGGHIRLVATVPANAPGEIEFAVVDEGAGISVPEQATLFTKFTRLSSAQRSDVTGTGLGLASCRLLADLMGGSVGVQSDPGQGARFYLRLPMVAAQAPVEAPKLALANTSVLLVEDADYNAWAATAVLAKLGLSCERARTGQEALRLFAEKRFNLVLLDRNLPDMDGTEVARRIRSFEEDGPRAILLAVTAYCTPQDRALCLESGMDAFVGKPLTPDKLRKILIAAGRRLLTAATMHVSPGAPQAPVDISLLDYMSDGTEEGLVKQVASFLDALAEGETRLTSAATAQDFARLAEAAHYLLSHAKLVGSAALEEAAVSLERAARAGDGFAFGELLQRVRSEIGAVTAAMRQHRPAAQPA